MTELERARWLLERWLIAYPESGMLTLGVDTRRFLQLDLPPLSPLLPTSDIPAADKPFVPRLRYAYLKVDEPLPEWVQNETGNVLQTIIHVESQGTNLHIWWVGNLSDEDRE